MKKIKYVESVKKKKDNPFLTISADDGRWLKNHIDSVIYWVLELHNSDQPAHIEIYKTFTSTTDREFGRSGVRHGYNTPLAALAGAAEKLRRGDLSRSQVNNITGILNAVAEFNAAFDEIVFENGAIARSRPTSQFDAMFKRSGTDQ